MSTPNEKYFTELFNSLAEGESTPWNMRVSCHASTVNTAELPASAMTMNVNTYSTCNHVSTLNYNFLTVHTETEIIQRHLLEYRKKRCTDAMPDCFKIKSHTLLYMALVDYAFRQWLVYDQRMDIIRAASRISNQILPWQSTNMDRSIISLIARDLNVTQLVASLILGDFIGIRPENCFSRFPLGKNKRAENCGKSAFWTPPEVLVAGGSVFKRESIYPIKSVGGHLIQIACRYTDGTESVTIYSDASLDFGKISLTAYPPAMNLIDSRPEATIHMCLCPDVVWSYLKLAREGNLADHSDIVVTGCFGGLNDFDALDLTAVAFHPVVLICSPDQPEWSGLRYMAKRCLDHGASSIKFYPHPLLA